MIRIILLAVALILAAGPAIGADGSAQRDPVFRYSDGSAKDNIIVRDKDGRRTGYLLNDPIFPGDQWILFQRIEPAPVKKADPIFPRFDLDPVGE